MDKASHKHYGTKGNKRQKRQKGNYWHKCPIPNKTTQKTTNHHNKEVMVQSLQLLEKKHYNGNNDKLPQGFPDNLASDPNLDI